jgi:osmoprotectant transport system permease protein
VDEKAVIGMISFLSDVVGYFLDGANWTGSRGLLSRLTEHVTISLLGVLVAAIIALPIAVWLGHVRRGGFVAVSLVNVGRAVPSFGVVGVLFPITLAVGFMASPLGFWATLIAMILLAMPPMFVNAYTAVRDVDDATVESARGMGMTEWFLLTRVEVALGLPLIMAGVRIAAVAVVATATLGAVVGYGGLGRYIIDGFAQGNDVLIFVGGILVAGLALLTELFFGWLERRVDPMAKADGSGRRSRSHRRTSNEPSPLRPQL